MSTAILKRPNKPKGKGVTVSVSVSTFVPKPLKGRGIAGELVKAAYEYADKEAYCGDDGCMHGCLPEHFSYTSILSGSIIVACDRLHALIQTHTYHDEHEYETVAYSVCSDSQISAVPT